MPIKNFIFTKRTNEDIVHTEEHENSRAPLWHQALADRRSHSRAKARGRHQAVSVP